MTDWDSSACQVEDPELFFSPNPNRALAICHTCPIELACQDATLTLEAQGPTVAVHGVAGGMTEDQRRAILNRAVRPCMSCGQPRMGARYCGPCAKASRANTKTQSRARKVA